MGLCWLGRMIDVFFFSGFGNVFGFGLRGYAWYLRGVVVCFVFVCLHVWFYLSRKGGREGSNSVTRITR